MAKVKPKKTAGAAQRARGKAKKNEKTLKDLDVLDPDARRVKGGVIGTRASDKARWRH